MFFFIVILGMSLQGTLAHLFAIRGIRPNLLLVLSISAGIRLGPSMGALCGFVGGLGIDLIGGRSIGLGALAFSAGAYVAGLIASGPLRESPPVYVLSAFIGTLLAHSITYSALLLLGFSGQLTSVLSRIVWPSTVYDTFLVLPACYLVSKALCKKESSSRL